MKLKVIKPFDWAHKHVRVESFDKGQVIETEDEDLIRVATEEGWAKPVKVEAATLKAQPTEPIAPPAADLADVADPVVPDAPAADAPSVHTSAPVADTPAAA